MKSYTVEEITRKATMKWKTDARNRGDGLKMMKALGPAATPLVIFDPQYRAVLDRMSYGNEGKSRMKERSALPQMDHATIVAFIEEIARILAPSGHLMMWYDKFTVCEGVHHLDRYHLKTVDMITLGKRKIGMGYRTRRKCEYLVIYQKAPIRAKGVWKDHGIPDVWTADDEERHSYRSSLTSDHPHLKPVGLQRRLIECVTNPGDLVVDPCAGGYSVLAACHQSGARYLGCDLVT